VLRIDLGHASVLDADLLLKQGNLASQAVDFGCLPGARVEGIGGPAPGRRDSVLGQGDDMQNG
jgi:hypothetical protein